MRQHFEMSSDLLFISDRVQRLLCDTSLWGTDYISLSHFCTGVHNQLFPIQDLGECLSIEIPIRTQLYVDSSVEYFFSSYLKLWLWPYHLCLNKLAVSPMYFFLYQNQVFSLHICRRLLFPSIFHLTGIRFSFCSYTISRSLLMSDYVCWVSSCCGMVLC